MNLEIHAPKHETRSVLHRTVGINRNSGRFTFNVKSIDELGIKAGMFAIIAKDTDSRNEWYVCISEQNICRNKIHIRKYAHFERTRVATFMNRKLAAEILDLLNAQNSAKLIISERPVQDKNRVWYRLLTSTPIAIK